MISTKKTAARLAAASLTIMLAACTAGNGEGLDANGRPLSETGSGSGSDSDPDTGSATDPTQTSTLFTRIQDEILTPDCATSGCHSGTSSPLGVNLDEGKAYDKLVNVESNQVNGLLLVEPSNAAASYLMHKIEGSDNIGGDQMPLYKPALSSDEIELVRSWIDAGALPSGSGGSEAPFEATLSDIQKYVFNTQCVDCHSGDEPRGEVNLQSGRSYSELVNKARMFDQDNVVYVVPGDADSSFLIDKLTGTGLGNIQDANYKGTQMPEGGPYLDDTTIQIIKDWINNGAENN